MHFITTLGQRWKESWKQAAGSVLTVVLLSGVAVGGLAVAGSDALASLKASEGPLTFDAPTSTLLRLQAKAGSAQNDKELAGDAALPVKDWMYTQRNVNDVSRVSILIKPSEEVVRIITPEQKVRIIIPVTVHNIVVRVSATAFR
jgi:hypothetical protein